MFGKHRIVAVAMAMSLVSGDSWPQAEPVEVQGQPISYWAPGVGQRLLALGQEEPNTGAGDSRFPRQELPTSLALYESRMAQRAETDENERLAAEASNLMKELELWRTAGPLLASREKQALQLIQQARQETTVNQVTASTLMSRPMLLGCQFVALAAVILAVCAHSFSCCKIPVPRAPSTWLKSTVCCKRARRAMGFDGFVLEISEIQVSLPGLMVEGDLCVTLDVGGKELCSRSAEVFDSKLVRFKDKFLVRVKPGDGMCMIGVIDRDSMTNAKVAHAQIPAGELLRMAHRPHGEYCSFRLTGPAGTRERPQIAMRVVDVSKEQCDETSRARSFDFVDYRSVA